MTFRELITIKGYTQLRLSKEAGVSQSNLSLYCNRREALEASTLITRMKLSQTLDLTLEQFEKLLNLEPAKMLANNQQLGSFKIEVS